MIKVSKCIQTVFLDLYSFVSGRQSPAYSTHFVALTYQEMLLIYSKSNELHISKINTWQRKIFELQEMHL